jgi:phenylpropionate dioxygenase-like ring-hydroxylating dioxygenase large terminal subunit
MDPSHVPYAHKGLIRQLRRAEDPGRYVPDLSFIFANANYPEFSEKWSFIFES